MSSALHLLPLAYRFRKCLLIIASEQGILGSRYTGVWPILAITFIKRKHSNPYWVSNSDKGDNAIALLCLSKV